MDRRKDTFLKAMAAMALFAIVAAVYWRVAWYGFAYDDFELILKNPWIRDFSYIPTIFTTHTFGFSEESYQPISYRPMLFLIYQVEYFFFGFSPRGWHLVNLAVHAANTVLVFVVVARLLASDGRKGASGVVIPSFIGALFFALHPANAEPVSWLACIAELTFTFLCLAGFYIMALSIEAGGRSGLPLRVASLAAPAMFFLAAMLLKETAVALPVIVLLYDLVRRDSGERLLTRARAARYLPFIAAGAVYAAMRAYALKGEVTPSSTLHAFLTAGQFLLNSAVLFSDYVMALAFARLDEPLQLLDPVYTVLDPRAIAAIALMAFISAALFIFRRRMSVLVWLGAAIVVLPILPTLYSPAISRFPFGDRYMYMPSAGAALLVALAFSSVIGRGRGWKTYAAAAVVTAVAATFFAYKAVERSLFWKDDLTLWSESFKGSAGNYAALHSIAHVYIREGKTLEAIPRLEEALRLNLSSAHPDASMALLTRRTLATAYLREEMLDKAAVQLYEILDMAPDDYSASYNLGLIHQTKGDCRGAIELYRRALVRAAKIGLLRKIYANMGDCYASLGLHSEAEASYSEAAGLGQGGSGDAGAR